MNKDLDKFRNLTFEDFSRMAGDESLLPHEKIGFPSAFREGFDSAILADLQKKLPALNAIGTTILDIGCGCGELTKLLIDNARINSQNIVLVDSAEVLRQIENVSFITKIEGKFPDNAVKLESQRKADVVICYSVFHYIFQEANPYEFIEKALSFVAPGGMLLLGDVPNVSKRNRFLNTAKGILFHQNLMQTTDQPSVRSYSFEEGKIDDGIIWGILNRYRNFGFETFLLPQPEELPLSNSREDILFIKY